MIERFLESTTVILSSASISSAAILITFPDVDIEKDIENAIISSPASIMGL